MPLFSRGDNRNRKKTTTARDVTEFYAFFFPPGSRAIFSTFCGALLTNLHRKPGENEKDRWRKFEKSSGDDAISVPCRGQTRPETNVHFSNVHFVLCQSLGLNHRTPPFHAFFPPPPLSIASALSELKWAITSPKKGQAMQRCHEEQSARSKGARLSPLDFSTQRT